MNSTNRKFDPEPGFSLIEVLVVVALLGIVASVSVALVGNISSSVEREKLVNDVNALNSAVGIYLTSGGSFDGKETATQVIAKLKSRATAETEAQVIGLRGYFVDPRLEPVMQMPGENAAGEERVYWNGASGKFEIATTGPPGIKEFRLNEDLAESPVLTEDRNSAMDYAHESTWVWDFQDRAAPMPVGPTEVETFVVAETGVPSASTNPGPPPPPPPTSILNPPAFSLAPGTFPMTDFNLSVSITNPNPAGSSSVIYSIDYGNWMAYTGSPLTISPDNVLKAQALPALPEYESSTVTEGTYNASPVNTPPHAHDNGYSWTYTYTGTTKVFNTLVLMNDWDPDGDPLTVVAVTDGAHGTVTIDGTGNPLFTSSPTFIDGTDSFTYTISDGRGGFDTATVNVRANAKPVVEDESITTTMDTPVSGNVLINDWDHGGDALFVEANQNPASGTVSIGADGNFTYTPNTGFTGSDSFRYTVADVEGGRTYGFVNISVVTSAGVEKTTGIDPGSWTFSGATASYTFDDGTRIVLTEVGTSWSAGTVNSWNAWSKPIDGTGSAAATFSPNDSFTVRVYDAANQLTSPESIELHLDRLGGSAGAGIFTLQGGLTWSPTSGNTGFLATSTTAQTALSGTNLSGGSVKLNQSVPSFTIVNEGVMDRIEIQVTVRVNP